MNLDYFENPTSGKLSLTSVSELIVTFIKAEPLSKYRIVIGSDSHERRQNGTTDLSLVSAVVVHRLGKGGRYFYQKQRKPRPHSIREKIYLETFSSLQLAEKILPLINRRLNGHKCWELEIHIDVGRSGETRDMIKEVVGMVNGNGFTAKTKPESYGASKVADKHA